MEWFKFDCNTILQMKDMWTEILVNFYQTKSNWKFPTTIEELANIQFSMDVNPSTNSNAIY